LKNARLLLSTFVKIFFIKVMTTTHIMIIFISYAERWQTNRKFILLLVFLTPAYTTFSRSFAIKDGVKDPFTPSFIYALE